MKAQRRHIRGHNDPTRPQRGIEGHCDAIPDGVTGNWLRVSMGISGAWQ